MLAQSSGAFQFFASCITFPVGETRPNDVQSGGHHSRQFREGFRGGKHSLIFPALVSMCRGDRGTNHRDENNYDGGVQSGLIFTSNRISRLFLSGSAKGGIEKMRSLFFQKTKSSGVPVIPPGGGTGPEAKATQQKGCVSI